MGGDEVVEERLRSEVWRRDDDVSDELPETCHGQGGKKGG